MKSVIVCPKCKKLVYFNSYFGAYICESCGWEDASYAKRRDSYVIATRVQAISKIRSIAKSKAISKAQMIHIVKMGKESASQKEEAIIG